MSFHLEAHLPVLVGWGRRTTAIYRIIILYDIIIILYYHSTFLYQGQAATK